MSIFPYTDDQVERHARAVVIGDAITDGDTRWSRQVLARLHEAGIAVTFPEPRYYTEQGLSSDTWVVRDRSSEFLVAVAMFCGAEAERYAREHADRLNREVSS